MSEASLVAFNLLVGAMGSFAVGALAALGAARVFRASPGRACVWLLLLPFAKLVLDVARGIPDASFLWQRARGLDPEFGSFRAGVGIEALLLKVELALGAVSGGVTYSQSAADLLASGLVHHVGPMAPAAVASLLALGAAFQIARRVRGLAAARAERARIEAVPASEVRRAGPFRVPIHLVQHLTGSPFTGGLLRPYVAFPVELWSALTPAEREAAIQHELAHVAELHVPCVTATGWVRDVFWFVPCIGRIHARLVAACELAADDVATRRGADPLALASALVRAGELGATGAPGGELVLGAARGELGRRVQRLLAPTSDSYRLGWGHAIARAAFVAWVAATVAIAVPFGNH